MRFTPRGSDPYYNAIEPVVRGLGFEILEFSVSKHKGSNQVRLTICRTGGAPHVNGEAASIGTAECAAVHKAVVPRLDLAFSDDDYSLMVMTPGIDRRIKDGAEFPLCVGAEVKLWRSGSSDWTVGIIKKADKNSVTIQTDDGEQTVSMEEITKAKLQG
jgi:ribosome maturation factor RimP